MLRIIPALAGNTHTSRTNVQSIRDHPRSRGEYMVDVPELVQWQGSSPLSRGIPIYSRGDGPLAGIIPALAGNTG